MCIDVETFHLGVRLHVSCSRRCNGLCSQSGDGIELFDFDGFGVLHGIHGASRVTLQLCGCVFLPGGRKRRRVPEHFLRDLFLYLFLHLHCLAVAGQAWSAAHHWFLTARSPRQEPPCARTRLPGECTTSPNGHESSRSPPRAGAGRLGTPRAGLRNDS